MSTTAEPHATDPHAASPGGRRRMPHAVVMMLLIITASVALTYVVPSGKYQRTKAGPVVPGSFHTIPKDYRDGVLLPRASTDSVAYPASPLAILTSIPAGMVRSAPLIMMILFIGGMFGVLQHTGAVNAGIDRLLAVTGGNAAIVVPVFMVLLACGSTFLGLISEYLVIIPIALVLAERLGRDALFGTAMVTVAAKIGYLTSVTNPLALAVAQPIVGVPVFSGAAFRAVTFVVFLPIGIWYVLRLPRTAGAAASAMAFTAEPLTARQLGVLAALVAAIAVMVWGVQRFDWGSGELSAMYIGLGLAIAIIGGVGSREASQAFVKGMQGMMLAGLLVGLAAAVEVVLRDGMVLDTIIASLTRSVEGKHPVFVANIMMGLQMIIDVFIPSTSGKAAVTMPILGPIGQLSGVSGQVTVQAFLFGNGVMNTVTPTSGMLLAYLATGKVNYSDWIRFIMPLVLLIVALCAVALSVMVLMGGA
ncbi:MAG TPA: Na+/H+ antiporter NhaC family protein [Gemmatimonadaceae bacterium]|nr:Na+/H+ antiporter NhaC family protein [Gemmatimonadaceae bacterium]